MSSMKKLKNQRESLLNDLAALDNMVCGKITTRSVERIRADGSNYQSAPYHKLQCWQEGKNVTRHVTEDEFPMLKEYVDNYQNFKTVCDKLADVTEQLTRLQDKEGVVERAIRGRKKKSSKRSPSKKSKTSSTPRSRTSSSKAR
jgi:hypothetical protein